MGWQRLAVIRDLRLASDHHVRHGVSIRCPGRDVCRSGVAFGEMGGGVLHSVACVSPFGWHPTGSSVHFCPFGWPHGPREACGLAGGLIATLNAEPPSTGMAVMGTGAWATRVSDGRAARLAARADPHCE